MDSEPNTKAAESESHALVPDEKKQRKQRNLAIALGLFAFIVIIFLVTILRIGGAVVDRQF